MRTRTSPYAARRRPAAWNPILMGAPMDSYLSEEFVSPQFAKDLGMQLVNSGLYDWALDDLPEYDIKRIDDKHAARFALLVHNQLRSGGSPRAEVRALTDGLVDPLYAKEDIQTGDLALPTKWALPIIRRIYPPIFDSPFFATQPMPGPLAYAFFLDFKREADGTDLRAVAPFTARISSTIAAAATSGSLQISANSGVVGYSPYQVVVGQQVTLSYGTANADTVTIQTINPATGAFTFTPAAVHSHAIGDWAYVTAPAALAEAAVPQKAKLSLTRQSVQANKWTLAATWSTEAMEDAKAQLNLDVEAEMVQAVATEIGRELFSTIIGDIVQGATGGNTTLPTKGGSSVQDYRWLAVQPIYLAEANIFARRFHDTDTMLCGIDMAANIAMQDQFHNTPADPGSTMSQLGVTYLGVFQSKWSLYKTAFLPPNLGLLFQKPPDWLRAGYVYMPYVPLAPMPLVYAGYSPSTGNYANTDEWTRNIRTRAGRLLTVSDEYALLTQG